MPNKEAEAFKEQGNGFFKAGTYWSNMAACHEKLKQYDEMAEASRNCIKADRTFVKGYFRLATAQKVMNDLEGCIKTLENGLGVQSSNTDLKNMKKEVIELQRGEQVAGYCAKAQEQIKSNDIAGAYKSLELASRLDAGNADIEKLMKQVKPKWDQLEAKRKKGLSGPDLYKEKGDDMYKNANFEGAVEMYTKCIDALKASGKGQSEIALKAYSNRAACYKQISNFDGTIQDCTAVLEVEPENVKALVRRAQAFEGVERYRFALQDVKTVLAMPFHKVGKQNFDLCNGMQHRLQRTVEQLKKMNSM
jgi:stress-induced-phosphoprotein 1